MDTGPGLSKGWQGIDTTLKLSGWAKVRRVVLLRHFLRGRVLKPPARLAAAAT